MLRKQFLKLMQMISAIFRLFPERNTFDFSHGDDTWSYVEDDKFPLSESAVLDKVSALTSVSSMRTIEDPDNLADFGLENPEVTATVTDTDGNETELALGATMTQFPGVI